TSLATVCALIVAALAVERRPSAGRIAALAACSGFAVLVRPFTGIAALLVCGAMLVRLKRTVALRTLAWAAPPLIASALIAAFFLLQLTFHVGGAIYHLEIFPSLALAAAAGAELLTSAALRLRRPLSQVALAGLVGAALFIAVQVGSAVEVVWRRASERAWVY